MLSLCHSKTVIGRVLVSSPQSPHHRFFSFRFLPAVLASTISAEAWFIFHSFLCIPFCYLLASFIFELCLRIIFFLLLFLRAPRTLAICYISPLLMALLYNTTLMSGVSITFPNFLIFFCPVIVTILSFFMVSTCNKRMKLQQPLSLFFYSNLNSCHSYLVIYHTC